MQISYQVIFQTLKPQNLWGVLNSMVKYKINLKFNDASKSLNEIITEVLKIELQKKFNITYYSSVKGSN